MLGEHNNKQMFVEVVMCLKTCIFRIWLEDGEGGNFMFVKGEAIVEWHKRSLKHEGSEKSQGIGIDEKEEWHAKKEQKKAELWGPGQ